MPCVPVVHAPMLPAKEPLPGWRGRFFDSERMTFAYYEIAGDAAPLHEHDHSREEAWHVLDGTLAVRVAGVEHVVAGGTAVIVPPNTLHSVRVLGPCRALVVDTPRREAIGGVRVSE